MISPNEIKKKAERKYLVYLQSLIGGLPLNDLIIRGDKTYNKSSLPEFEKEILFLISHSKEKKGFGYTLEFQKVKTKYLGTQDLPTVIFFETEKDFLKFIGKEKEVEIFKKNYENITTLFPILKVWAVQNPSKIIQNQAEWQNIMKVCAYFEKNPKPNLYIRELPINVHTKFIEQHQSIIRDLLEVILQEHLNPEEKQFEKRFNLKYNAPQVRFKILDEEISQSFFHGCDDIAIPINQFEALKLPIENVLIVENKTSLYTTLTLPPMEKTIAIFGQGNAVLNLQNAKWLSYVKILYWGDIDVQGFEILSRLRAFFPNIQSILMDKITFEKFFENDIGTPTNNSTELNLKTNEKQLYDLLKTKNWRLEQEKIPIDWVNQYFDNF